MTRIDVATCPNGRCGHAWVLHEADDRGDHWCTAGDCDCDATKPTPRPRKAAR